MSKLIYFETQLDKNKNNLKALRDLRIEIFNEYSTRLDCLDQNALINLLERVNKNINFLVDKE